MTTDRGKTQDLSIIINRKEKKITAKMKIPSNEAPYDYLKGAHLRSNSCNSITVIASTEFGQQKNSMISSNLKGNTLLPPIESPGLREYNNSYAHMQKNILPV